MNQYQVISAVPGCSVGDIITANQDGSLTSTDGTITYPAASANFATFFAAYDPSAAWTPLARQTIWTFGWSEERAPALSVVSMPYDPGSTALTVLTESSFVFPTEDAANTAIAAMLAALVPVTNQAAQLAIQPSPAQPA